MPRAITAKEKRKSMNSIDDAKRHLREKFEKGTSCPCCGQFVKAYKRKLNSGMARTLIAIYRAHGKEPVHVKNFLKDEGLQNNHDWTLLKFWGFMAPEASKDTSKRDSGIWRVTDLGEKFIKGNVPAESHKVFYNGKELPKMTLSDHIDIVQALGEHFDYKELMGLSNLQKKSDNNGNISI